MMKNGKTVIAVVTGAALVLGMAVGGTAATFASFVSQTEFERVVTSLQEDVREIRRILESRFGTTPLSDCPPKPLKT